MEWGTGLSLLVCTRPCSQGLLPRSQQCYRPHGNVGTTISLLSYHFSLITPLPSWAVLGFPVLLWDLPASAVLSAQCSIEVPPNLESANLERELQEGRTVCHRSLPCFQKSLPYIEEWGPWTGRRGDRPKRWNRWAPCNLGRGAPALLVACPLSCFLLQHPVCHLIHSFLGPMARL